MAKLNVKPPNRPWEKLIPRDDRAVIGWHYSDSNTKIPIRDVSHRTDAKADPNIETMTYGLFSTCNKPMRKSIVKNKISTVFFCTSREKAIRVCTGYYKIGWYYEFSDGDYMLAAEKCRFVSPGFPLKQLNDYLGYPIGDWFYLWKYIEANYAKKLLDLIDSTPDFTSKYVKEISRLTILPRYSWRVAPEKMGILR